jgi:hypothetical protein
MIILMIKMVTLINIKNIEEKERKRKHLRRNITGKRQMNPQWASVCMIMEMKALANLLRPVQIEKVGVKTQMRVSSLRLINHLQRLNKIEFCPVKFREPLWLPLL